MASTCLWIHPFLFLVPPQIWMAFWFRLLLVSGTMRVWSQKSLVPSPWHSGHAPRWELNEKCFGDSAGSS